MVEKQLGILDLVNNTGNNEEREPVNWVNKKDLAPGMVFKGKVESCGIKTDNFEWKGKEVEVENGFVILRDENGLTGLKFPWATFKEIVKHLQPDDEVEIKYIGTVSQLQIINPELYKTFKEMNANENVRLFEATIKTDDPEEDEKETEDEIKGE